MKLVTCKRKLDKTSPYLRRLDAHIQAAKTRYMLFSPSGMDFLPAQAHWIELTDLHNKLVCGEELLWTA